MSLRRNSNKACATPPFLDMIFIFKQVGQVQLLEWWVGLGGKFSFKNYQDPTQTLHMLIWKM